MILNTTLTATGFAVACAVGVVHAQDIDPLKGDITAFETCFIQLMIDNTDNPMLGVLGPVVCGERHIPMGQTCVAVGYMLFDSRAACKADDLMFWQTQVAARAAAAIADGRTGAGMTHNSGLEGCADLEAKGQAPLDCLIEIHWRTSMEFMAADLVAELTGAKQ